MGILNDAINGRYLLGAGFGLNTQLISSLSTSVLKKVSSELNDTFASTFGGDFQQLINLVLNGQMGQAVSPPNPDKANAQGYASVDLASEGSNLFENILNRQNGAEMERLLSQNPELREQVEMMLGGRIVNDGVQDGRLTLEPFSDTNKADLDGNAKTVRDYMDRMMGNKDSNTDSEVSEASQIKKALREIIRRLAMGKGSAEEEAAKAAAGGEGAGEAGGADGAGAADGKGAAGGKGAAESSSDGGSVSDIMSDPSLTMEDKIVMMLMKIMNEMDDEIEAQAKKIEDLQSKAKKNGGSGDTSIDTETMKLSRLTQKRGNMFDTLRTVIDQYDKTADNMIQSMGR